MAAVFKIDGYDLYPYLRVAPGEGFDPIDADKVNPIFADSGLSEGQPLIAINEDNGEFVVPVHLNPAKSSGSFASTRQGLNDLIVDLNKRLSVAARVEWQDEGATNSTFYDIQFARFEPEYNFRRAGGRWMSGIIRIWTKPYGHTGTSRLVGTGATVNNFVTITSVPSIAGDVRAVMWDSKMFFRSSASYANPSGYFAALSVIPSGHIPVNVQFAVGPTQIADTSIPSTLAFGRQPWKNSGPTSSLSEVNFASATVAALSTAIDGMRFRLIAVGRVGPVSGNTLAVSGTYLIYAKYTSASVLLGPVQAIGVPTSSSATPFGWQAIDLGVWQKPNASAAAGGNGAVSLMAAITTVSTVASSNASATFDVAGVMVLPEDDTAVWSEGLGISGYMGPNATAGLNFVEDVAALNNNLPITSLQRGRMPRIPVGTRAVQVAAVWLPINKGGAATPALLNDPVALDVRVVERFRFGR